MKILVGTTMGRNRRKLGSRRFQKDLVESEEVDLKKEIIREQSEKQCEI